ncbi:MAG: zf-HC2 domain-containing protein [Terracidiphilus sp.]|jgi:anti-sigma factor RsiW
MNGCEAVQARFTEYLDGWLNGREMQQVAAHLESCRECEREWESLRRTQGLLAELGAVPEPEDLLLRIRVAVSQERAKKRQGAFEGWNLAWKNTVGPFLLQASAGFASAVLLLGTVIVLVTMFTQPESAQASKDEPLGNPTAPRLVSLSTGAGSNEIGDSSGPVVVEVYINGAGRMYDYRIVSGPTDAETRSQVENLLLTSVFEPARFFGQPVRGLAVISFSGVSVKG